jgi:hypothetical protein
MKIKQDYNITLVQKFFATFVFGEGEEIPMTWMTREVLCHSNIVYFANLLGYEFRGVNSLSGAMMHVDGEHYDKKLLAPLYLRSNPKVVIGDTFGLSKRCNTTHVLGFHRSYSQKFGCHQCRLSQSYSHHVFFEEENVE